MWDEITKLLIQILSAWDGWVVVVVFGLYVGWQIYRKHEDGRALRIVENTVKQTLEALSADIRYLGTRIDRLVDSWPKS